MPELPDIAILADALDTALSSRRLEEVTIREPLVVRGTPRELDAMRGQVLRGVARRGKFLTFTFERDRLVINAMLTGRLGLASAGAKAWPRFAAILHFGPRAADPDAGPLAPPAWLDEADWLPVSDERVELRYRDATRMGKFYVLPAGVARVVAGWDEQGPDVDDASLTIEEWRRRIGRHTAEIKNVLRNQAFVAGIGNAYSDEILWSARLAPFRTRASLADSEIDALFRASREVMTWAIAELQQRVPPKLEIEQRGFLRVHGKGGEPCPRCGSTISEVKAGGFVTNWCRGCQR